MFFHMMQSGTVADAIVSKFNGAPLNILGLAFALEVMLWAFAPEVPLSEVGVLALVPLALSLAKPSKSAEGRSAGKPGTGKPLSPRVPVTTSNQDLERSPTLKKP